MEWKTSIATSTDKETLIRGYPLEELIGNVNFTEAIYLVLKGELPPKEHRIILDAIFTACVDHGTGPASVIAARTVASGGNPLNAAVAGGVASLGTYHGGAIDGCAEMLEEAVNHGREASAVVKEYLDKKKRILGYGHKIYTEDPRIKKLFELAKEHGVFGKHCEVALEIEEELEKQKGRKLCLNVDGAIAALILEMGFPASLGKGFFIIPRIVGLTAHAHEELTEEKPVRRVPNEEITYLGPGRRKLPEE